jgi:hypothetical protein
MPSLARSTFLVITLVLGCTTSTSSDDKPAKSTEPAKPEEPQTKCDDDDDCRLSCIEPGNCCGEPPFCDKARHWDDHAKVEATRTNCLDFDYQTCPQADHAVPDEVALPKCKRKRCIVETIEREPPPAPIDVSGYDRTCASDADCVVVHVQPCAKCGCGQHPIAASEHEKFRAAIDAVKCPPHDPWPDIDCGDCRAATPRCEQGQCTAG